MLPILGKGVLSAKQKKKKRKKEKQTQIEISASAGGTAQTFPQGGDKSGGRVTWLASDWGGVDKPKVLFGLNHGLLQNDLAFFKGS